MNHPPTDIILGQRALGLLRYIIDSRGPCKVSIPETTFSWTTLLSALEREGSEDILLIQGNQELLQALSLSGKGEVLLEYADENGVLCHFKVAVIRTSPGRIWGRIPAMIYRVQRRLFFRVKAQPETEVVFSLEPGRKVRGRVQDYSLGGMAFWSKDPLPLKTDDLVEDLCLRIPEKDRWFEVFIYGAVVQRVELKTRQGKSLYALELLGMARRTRRQFASHILEKKRMLLRKFKIPPFLLEGPRTLRRAVQVLPSAVTRDQSSPRFNS